ncbi:hypothetical protein, variant 1 [Aphanomyces invadans]|uniref:Major facilitator superfamily associated domain-containing protein n=1 Tax=Aphanomyces invadans TaxID=157072 RepID=A0A024TIB0_9STRA|nr:hypothetical protein, variant 1 [Aphanomyces invadans]ETV93880.1 hypothetical protein, variant 1 [Aphanomyces invadans]|eukprot:XP_008877440.1 hypothetical protein, variant 1 [Aphanomyces invadans]
MTSAASVQHRAVAEVLSAVDDEDDKKEKRSSQNVDVPRWMYVAFCAETCASVLLTATFNTFHVETFLTEYKLELSSYATGHAIYAAINTLNDIVGAAVLDSLSLTKGRAWLLQCGGLLWSLCFLLPWYPWPSYPAVHFVFSLSCYDTMYSFCAIAGGSLLTEMDITDSQRIHVLRVKSIFGMATTLLVTSLGQTLFPHKSAFRFFCAGLTLVSGVCFAVFYYAIERASPRRSLSRSAPSSIPTAGGAVPLKAVLGEFWHLSNFHAWLGMEMCLETQANFNRSYLRLFVTTFVPDPAIAPLFVSILPVAKQFIKIAAFSALDRLGVYEVYKISFRVKLAAAFVMLVLGGSSGASLPSWIVLAFIAVNTIVTDVPTGGFTVAMSNMHKEMSLRYFPIDLSLVRSPPFAERNIFLLPTGASRLNEMPPRIRGRPGPTRGRSRRCRECSWASMPCFANPWTRCCRFWQRNGFNWLPPTLANRTQPRAPRCFNSSWGHPLYSARFKFGAGVDMV